MTYISASGALMSDINPGNVYLQTRYDLNTVCSISDGSSIAPSCHPYCQCNYHLISTLTLQYHPISIARVRHLDRTALHLPQANIQFQRPLTYIHPLSATCLPAELFNCEQPEGFPSIFVHGLGSPSKSSPEHSRQHLPVVLTLHADESYMPV